MAAKYRIEGVDYILGPERTKTWARKRRKPTLAELKAAQALSDTYYEQSAAIRARSGLDPLPPTKHRQALDAAIAEGEAKAAAKAAKAAKSANRPPTKAQLASIAEAALALLDLGLPETQDEAEGLLDELEAVPA